MNICDALIKLVRKEVRCAILRLVKRTATIQ